VVLEKTDGTTKQFRLAIRMVGEKVASPTDAIASHNFYTTSPLAFVAQAQPQRSIYLCTMQDYSEQAGLVANEVRSWATKLREDSGGAAIANADADARLKLYTEVREKAADGATRVMESVQLEPGKYKMTLRVHYRRPSGFRTPRLTTQSSITFEMPNYMRATIKGQLKTYFETTLVNLVFGTTDPVSHPSVAPQNVVEVLTTKTIAKQK
jgi:hypothetical protein